ncbi:class I SAM-dependent methyltransferase [Candidatus Harpocratesius sp.]
MLPLNNVDLSDKTILEIGTGNGGTTRDILKYIKDFPTSRLITTDIVNRDLSAIIKQTDELLKQERKISFIQTDASELKSILANSVDIIVVDYTICAINMIAGKIPLCFYRWIEVMKPGGLLFIEDEFPITSQSDIKYIHWRRYWQLVKSLVITAGGSPYHEIDPKVLSMLLENYGFKVQQFEEGDTILEYQEIKQALQNHYSDWLHFIHNRWLRFTFRILKRQFLRQLKNNGGDGSLIIPYYSLSACLKE